MFILISSGQSCLKPAILSRGGETSYIRATVSLYVSLYNIFVSLLKASLASQAGTNLDAVLRPRLCGAIFYTAASLNAYVKNYVYL